MKNIAILLLAGDSTRFKSPINKIFAIVNNRPLFSFPLETLISNSNIDEVIVVSKQEFKDQIMNSNIVKNSKITITFALGGTCRSESVKNALDRIENSKDINVLICDGDRPNLTDEIIDRNVESLKTHDGCITAVKSVDSSFVLNDKIEYLDRAKLFNAQTPQSFHANIIKEAYQNQNYKNFTDDASIVLKMDYNIAVVEGDYCNYKITTKSDFDRFLSEKKI